MKIHLNQECDKPNGWFESQSNFVSYKKINVYATYTAWSLIKCNPHSIKDFLVPLKEWFNIFYKCYIIHK